MTPTQLADSAASRQISRLALFASIVESVDDAIISGTDKGIITSWNPAAERMYGYSAQEAVGLSISMIIPQEKLEEARALFKGISEGVPVVHYETVRLRRD